MTNREKSWLLPAFAAALTAGIFTGRFSSSFLFGAAAALFSLAAALLLQGRARWVACLLLALSLGNLTGFLSFHPGVPEEGDYRIQGVITEEIRTGSLGHHSTRLSHVSLDGTPCPGGLYWTFYSDEEYPRLLPGAFVQFDAHLYAPGGVVNPDGYDFREELLRRGMIACVYGADGLEISRAPFFSPLGSAASVRHDLSGRLLTLLGPEVGGYASTMLLGSRSLIPSEDRAAFARLGIAHLLSVSGFHVGILYAFLMFLLRPFRPGRKLSFLLTGILLLTYCFLCGLNQPVLRASVLILLSQFGRIHRRPVSRLHLLSAAYILLLLLSPVQLTGVSFQLTFSAVLGIVLIAPTIEGLIASENRFLQRLWQSFAVTLSVQIGILVPQLAAYQQFPLLTFLINGPALLLGSLMILLFWIVLMLLPLPFLAGLAAGPVSRLCGWLIDSVHTVSSLPGISLWTPAATWLTAVGVVLLFLALSAIHRFSFRNRMFSFLLGLTLVIGSLIPGFHDETEYIQFSVGNADAAVLWDRDQVYVYDTGENDGVVSNFLRRRRLTPTAVILTHLHADHAGGLQSLMDDGIPVPVCYLPAGAEDQLIHEDVAALMEELRARGTQIRYLSRGDSLPLPSGRIEVLWPYEGRTRPGQDANHYSLVSLIRLNHTTMLEAGDLSGIYEKYVSHAADILKAPHHGSASSSTGAFMAAVDPDVILLTCGKNTRAADYAERLRSYAERNIFGKDHPDLYATSLSGAIRIRFLAEGYEVHPFLPDGKAGIQP